MNYTPDEIREGNRRLLNAAIAVEQHPDPSRFSMRWSVYNDGTPGDVIGSYASRRDLQQAYSIKRDPDRETGCLVYFGGRPADFGNFTDMAAHFAMTQDEASYTFGGRGCGGAKTPKEAGAYIRALVASREAALSSEPK